MLKAIYPIDDDDAVRSSLHALLSAQPGVLVRSFASGDAFLAAAGELDGGVLLLDINMPGTNGIEVLHRLRARDPAKFAAVVLTGQGNIETAVAAMRAGAVDFVEKPFESEALLRVVDAALALLADRRRGAVAREQARARIARLSPRERDVLAGMTLGKANKLIAHDLGISMRTVEIYRANLMAKLGVPTLADVVRLVLVADLADEKKRG